MTAVGSASVVRREMNFIGGAWCQAATAARIQVRSPVDGAEIGSVPAASDTEVDMAVAAAVAARTPWRRTSPRDRAAFLQRIGERLDERREELVEMIAAEVGAPLSFIRGIHVAAPIDRFLGAPALVESVRFSTMVGRSIIREEPIGVVAAVTPWNYPLLQVAEKIVPALLAGCPVVLKPSEITPMTAFMIADAVEEAGLPDGVFNLVCGSGSTVGERLVGAPGIDMVSFTGSTRAGRRISAIAAQRVIPTMMELGGKSPSIILEDLTGEKFDAAVEYTLENCVENAGQTCTALTRLIVPSERRSRAEAVAGACASAMRIGGPATGADVGPLISETQLARVERYVDEAVVAGARIVAGGHRVEEAGAYYQPTVLSDVTPDMRIAREEVFGPVLVIISAHGDDDAIEIANDTDYGLAAAVWGNDLRGVREAAEAVRAGWVIVNGAQPDGDLPFGGMKQSGHGREAGAVGVMEYLASKAMTA